MLMTIICSGRILFHSFMLAKAYVSNVQWVELPQRDSTAIREADVQDNACYMLERSFLL